MKRKTEKRLKRLKRIAPYAVIAVLSIGIGAGVAIKTAQATGTTGGVGYLIAVVCAFVLAAAIGLYKMYKALPQTSRGRGQRRTTHHFE